MKKVITLLFTVVSILSGQTDLLISEYVEGSSNNKAIEIFNGTGSAIDLSAGNYAIEMYFNGSTSAGLTINLIGNISSGDVYVVAHASAVPSILAVANLTNASGWFNGDDAIVLKKGSTILDVLGQVGTDPGSEWGTGLTSTADNTLRRKIGTTIGDTNPNDAFDPSIEWDGFAKDTFDGLGDASPLPVELTTFTASVSDQTVELNWETATEVNNYGFEVERKYQLESIDKQEWTKVGFVNGHGNSNSTKYYSYSDNKIAASGKYLYRLKQVDFDGAFEYSNVIEANLGSPVDFELIQNYPNPFNPVTNIQFNLPEDSQVRLSVFNVLGEEVAQLVNGNIAAGFHSVKFDGAKFNSGIYFYKLESENFVQIRKMMLVK